MQKIIFAIILAAIFSVALISNPQLLPKADAAAVDYFLKMEGVDGESKDDKYKGWIELESYSFGVSSAASSAGSGGGAGKIKFNEFTIKKVTDKSSPILMMETATGKHYPKAEFVVMKPDGSQYYKITFKDVLISSYQTSGGADEPMEQVSLNFAQIEFEYGSVKVGWDIKANKRIDETTTPDTAKTTETKTTTPAKPSTTPTTPSTQPTTRAPADSDGDGITDDKDKCPTEAETKNSYQDDDGCSDRAPTTATVPKTITPIAPKVMAPLK